MLEPQRRDEVPTALSAVVSEIPADQMHPMIFGQAPTWYLSNLIYTANSLSFNYYTNSSNPNSASAWWVLWECSMRDYAYYNASRTAWNWLPTSQYGKITYAVTLAAGQLNTLALFRNNNWGLADYVEFQT